MLNTNTMQTKAYHLSTLSIGKKAMREIIEILKHSNFQIRMFGGMKTVMQGNNILGWIEPPVKYNGESNSKFIRKL